MLPRPQIVVDSPGFVSAGSQQSAPSVPSLYVTPSDTGNNTPQRSSDGSASLVNIQGSDHRHYLSVPSVSEQISPTKVLVRGARDARGRQRRQAAREHRGREYEPVEGAGPPRAGPGAAEQETGGEPEQSDGLSEPAGGQGAGDRSAGHERHIQQPERPQFAARRGEARTGRQQGETGQFRRRPSRCGGSEKERNHRSRSAAQHAASGAAERSIPDN
ncbi:hypothetical protein KL949_000627 [Ogataea haglerorum]|nr:hypothetical protein KL914_000137 [Ogataea haglerorum]KAG7722319.1 hypothetical protein KL913_000139 [Ogataea haglerorum]KAG7723577.1 hypothetical protein KL949_000627 [Ogataea haglerorum]KAG7750948.1 hypothetical protein KL912_000081 [Ogataea haglerorum]KAG7771799.1 hypothetical protein KL931_000139 [Ogataea haglerorum]